MVGCPAETSTTPSPCGIRTSATDLFLTTLSAYDLTRAHVA